jgi:two-component system, NtrC family, sensor kinase
MRLRLNLQWTVLLLVAAGMTLILGLSDYLHRVMTGAIIEDARYNRAVGQTIGIAERVVTKGLFTNEAALSRDIRLVAARRDFRQIDVFVPSPHGLHLAASTAPDADRLPALDENSPDNDLGEMEHPLPTVVTMEVVRDGVRHWLISVALKEPGGTGYVSALVDKTSAPQYLQFLGRLQRQQTLILSGAMAVCVALLYFLFLLFFRRPARDIVQAMTEAGSNLASRAEVRRRDELGAIARGFNTMMEDISARDREREALMTRINGFNQDLQREVVAATRELRATNEALFQSQQRLGRSERLAAMGQVAASLAHEIGTPLNSISGHIQLLARHLRGDVDSERRLRIVSEQIEFIVKSVRAVLQRTHKPLASPRRMDLNQLVDEVLRLVAPTLEAHGIDAATVLHPALPPVLGDRESLQQVFLNLINNSVDAMPRGGRLEIATRPNEHARVAEVDVRDSGAGIPAEAADRLFEPLWTTKATGSGFGLAIVRDIVHAHGGTIELGQEPGQGATFRLRLPLAQDVAIA